MDKCNFCDKPAVEYCAQCGMPLCKDHIQHGIQFRTNEPSINCPNCQKNISRLTHKLSITLLAVFVVIIIITLAVLNAVFSFL